MNKQLQKLSVRVMLPKILTAAVIALILLGFSIGGVVKLLAGPKPLASVDTGNLSGKYVSFDASEVIVAVASLTSESNGSTETLKTYYLLPVGEQYVAVMDRKEKNSSTMDRAMSQSQEYYLGDLETLTKIGTISGTVSNMETGMETFMTDCITKYELPGYDAAVLDDLILPYQINLNQVGLLSTTMTLILFAVGMVFACITLAMLIPVFIGVFQKKSDAVLLQENTAEEADAMFAEAESFERAFVGKYIWFMDGASSRAVKTSEIIWGYVMPEPLVVSKYRWPVALYDYDRTPYRVFFAEKKTAQNFLKAIAAQGHPFIGEYSPNYNQMFKSDFDSFKKLAEHNEKES